MVVSPRSLMDGASVQLNDVAKGEFLVMDLPVATGDPKKTRRLRAKSAHKDIPDPSTADPDTLALLNQVYPCKRWVDGDGTVWEQAVSPSAPHRVDVVRLSDRLQAALKNANAQSVGLSMESRRIHASLFDEILRQLLISSPELGVALLSVRKSLEDMLSLMEEVYICSASVSFRRALHQEKDLRALAARVVEERSRHEELLVQKDRALKSLQEAEEAVAEQRQKAERVWADEAAALRKELQVRRLHSKKNSSVL